MEERILNRLIDFIDGDIPYSVFCAVLVEIYKAM